jgi:DNA helicase-2/ATP-dependent DNA helicase PcrA
MTLRAEQGKIAEYRGGKMAVSAVPGSGKTHTLASLAVELIANNLIQNEGEVLVVTFTNSAVETVRSRIRRMLSERKLPDAGYRVMTLHGLANSIIRERPDLAGTVSDYRIDDEISGQNTMPEAARWFTQQHRDYWLGFLPGDMSGQQRFQVEEKWRDATERLGAEVTKLAKNLRLTPAAVRGLIEDEMMRAGERDDFHNDSHTDQRERVDQPASASPFLRIGTAIYERYDQIMSAGGRLDFDDLIWGAIRALNNDEAFRRRLSARWQFILEDEAQDSTPLQEVILSILSEPHGNWVRVGDPNQAIMTTFTASDVRYFRDYMRRPDVVVMPLTVSGRSAQPIIDLANRLVEWAVNHHPEGDVRREALTDETLIRPTEAGDMQQNPPAGDARIHLQGFTDEDTEVLKIAQHAVKFILAQPDRTCAILVPTNYQGERVVSALERMQQEHVNPLYQDQLRNAQPVRDVARVLGQAVRFCGQPTNMNVLADLRNTLVEMGLGLQGDPRNGRIKTLLRSARPERLLFPLDEHAPAMPEAVEIAEGDQREIEALSVLAAKWLRASVLPVDQLILSASQDLFTSDRDLAIAHSLAVSLRRFAHLNPQATLTDIAGELDEIATNRQRYMSSSLIEAGFEPQEGLITVTTMHKAKGLEWDRVYLLSVDRIEFPHDADAEFRGQQWFLGGHDPATEARKALELLVDPAYEGLVNQVNLVREAHVEYIAERLRLLYVGITRARRELVVSYARQRFGQENAPALAVREVLRDTV